MTPEHLSLLWNQEAAKVGLPRVSKLSHTRERVMLAALDDEGDQEVWTLAFRAICNWKFARGENDSGWRASLDYAIRPSKRDRWLDEARETLALQREQQQAAMCACGGVPQNGSSLCYSCLSEKARTG